MTVFARDLTAQVMARQPQEVFEPLLVYLQFYDLFKDLIFLLCDCKVILSRFATDIDNEYFGVFS